MSIDFDSKTTYGDDQKYKQNIQIKTKTKTCQGSITTNFYNKKGSNLNTRRKNTT